MPPRHAHHWASEPRQLIDWLATLVVDPSGSALDNPRQGRCCLTATSARLATLLGPAALVRQMSETEEVSGRSDGTSGELSALPSRPNPTYLGEIGDGAVRSVIAARHCDALGPGPSAHRQPNASTDRAARCCDQPNFLWLMHPSLNETAIVHGVGAATVA